MSMSMYQALVPPARKMFTNMVGILDQAIAYAEARDVAHSVLLETRLYPDMLPLSFQLKVFATMGVLGPAMLAGVDMPAEADGEATFQDWQARLHRGTAHLNGIRRDQIDGTEDKDITVYLTPVETTQMRGEDFLLHYIHAHFYFHATTAYDILRKSGVELGKRYFTGPL